MGSVHVNGIEMHYREAGEGTPLLLVHAFPLGSAMWEPQLGALSGLGRVIAPDLRGFGETPLGETPAALEQYADDLAALLDELGVAQTALGGLSMGGYIAFAFLRKYRARVTALLLADTRAGPDSEEGRQGRERNAVLAEREGAGAIAEQMLPKLVAAHAPDSLREQLRGMIAANPAPGIAAALRAMAARPDSSLLLPTIDIPTLVLVGAEDTLTPPEEARDIHASIANSRLVEIPAAGHLSNLERPDAFNAAVREWMAET
ncbi:MAG TPA: alpha/beta fold hydrolase [Roseiflexaceae bacterium]|nr:alpha/beta fold hydrolase [Roseiflexaceae bacterium]